MVDNKFEKAGKILVLDFDHTCYDTDAFLLFEIRKKMLERYKVPTWAFERSYHRAVRQGYTFRKHMSSLSKILKHRPLSRSEERKFEAGINFRNYLFKDVLPFLRKARKYGYKIIVLSFGDKIWQNKKVRGSGLRVLVDVVKYTKVEGGKSEALKKYASSLDEVIFIENNGRDLDRVVMSLPRVKRYLMNRVPKRARSRELNEFLKIRYAEARKISERKSSFRHRPCYNFRKIVL